MKRLNRRENDQRQSFPLIQKTGKKSERTYLSDLAKSAKMMKGEFDATATGVVN